MADLPNLMNILVAVAVLWYLLGVHLGFSPGALDTIDGSCTGVEKCLLKLLTTWINGNGAKVSKLITALESRSVNNKAVAKEVRDHFRAQEGLLLKTLIHSIRAKKNSVLPTYCVIVYTLLDLWYSSRRQPSFTSAAIQVPGIHCFIFWTCSCGA